MEEISESVFKDCINLKEVVFEEGSRLKKIGKYAFSGCSNLRNIRLPEGLEHIGNGCFCETNLEEITIPSSVATIEEYAFYNCRSLKKVTL